jgi:ribosome-binding ATPase
VEKRMERAQRDFQKGKKDLAEELELLQKAREILDAGKPLRLFPPATESEKLRGFSFLSSKPQLVLINAGENKTSAQVKEKISEISSYAAQQPDIAFDWLYADTEAEIARLSKEEAMEFLQDLDLDEDAKDRIVKKSFELLDLIVFFTAGEPEVRAWPLKKGKTALKAAGTVHSDMERGFIRAEIVAFDEFKEAGSLAAAHKVGKVRLEGREYVMKDGDIVLFRFNV